MKNTFKVHFIWLNIKCLFFLKFIVFLGFKFIFRKRLLTYFPRIKELHSRFTTVASWVLNFIIAMRKISLFFWKILSNYFFAASLLLLCGPIQFYNATTIKNLQLLMEGPFKSWEFLSEKRYQLKLRVQRRGLKLRRGWNMVGSN